MDVGLNCGASSLFVVSSCKQRTPKIASTTITTAITVIGNKEVALDFGMLTGIEVPFKVDAGIEARHSVSATNTVATEAHLFPFQYSMTLVKIGAR